MPVYLSLVLCAALACRTVVPALPPFAGLAACQQAGQLAALEWQQKGWRVERVRCSLGAPPPSESAG